MKVLQIIQTPQLRGAEIFTCQVALELVRKGATVDIAYLFERDSFDLNFDLKFIPLGGVKKKRFYDFAAYRKLNELLRANHYEIVQVNSGDTLKYAVLSKLIYGWRQPLVFRNANRISDFIRGKATLLFNKFLLRKVDYVISVSENCRQDVMQIYPPLSTRSKTIFQATYDFGFRGEVYATPDEPVILNVSSFVPEKNHSFLFQAFKAFREKHSRGVLWLVGHGPRDAYYQSMVREMGIGEHVKFWGYRKDVIDILKKANVFLLPSLIEGLPGAILESFSCGVPVIASAVGGIPEAIQTGQNGICLREWNVDAYVDALEKILFDDAFRESQVREARARFLTHFNVTRVSDDFGKTYEQLLRP